MAVGELWVVDLHDSGEGGDCVGGTDYGGGMETPTVIPTEDKDWTFVITDGCAECGFVPPEPREVADRVRAMLPFWQERLTRSDATIRPAPTTWSPTEYACHVRDVFTLVAERLRLIVALDNPLFENWDQDATAVAKQYWRQDPAVVSTELELAGQKSANAFDSVRNSEWRRPGRRSNGSVFTAGTLAVYFLHDVEHHVHDVS